MYLPHEFGDFQLMNTKLCIKYFPPHAQMYMYYCIVNLGII